MSLHKLIYLLGEKIRNPLVRPYLKSLQDTEFSSIEELQRIQLRRLRKLLEFASRNSLFYKDRLVGLSIEDLTLDQLQDIPVLTKKELKTDFNSIKTYKNNKGLIKSETSGTTGDPFIFYRNVEWDAAARAANYRGYEWYGVRPWDKNIYFWGFNPSMPQRLKIRVLDFLMNRYRIFSFNKKTINKAIKQLKESSYIEGYSSAVFTLTQRLEESGVRFQNIKLVKGTSEKIYDYYHNATDNVYGKKMVSEYGSAETGLIAFECPFGNMHIAMENVIIEEIENKILVTNLFSYSLPIIRYELGDYISLDLDTKCGCGRNHYIIKEVTGRIGKHILGHKDNYPSFTLYYIFKNIALTRGISLAYFGVQNKKGSLILQIVRPKNSENKLSEYILIECDKYFENDIQVEIQFIDEIDRKNKKTQDFESFVK